MAKHKETTSAREILHRRYVKGDPDRKAALEVERANAQVARMIRDLRIDAELSQTELAELVGTTQSVISRLEDADYEGHSLSMLNRIARALNQKVTVHMVASDPAMGTLRFVFRVVLQDLRRARGLTIDELAEEVEIDRNELLAIERVDGYRPTSSTLHKLGEFHGIPEHRLAALAGVIQDVRDDVREHASRFAAEAESIAGLTKEERKALDNFVRVLKAQGTSDG